MRARVQDDNLKYVLHSGFLEEISFYSVNMSSGEVQTHLWYVFAVFFKKIYTQNMQFFPI